MARCSDSCVREGFVYFIHTLNCRLTADKHWKLTARALIFALRMCVCCVSLCLPSCETDIVVACAIHGKIYARFFT